MHPDQKATITMQGKMKGRIGRDRYMLSDETGLIHLDIGDEFMRQAGCVAGDVIRIQGAVEFRPEKMPEINVRSVTVLHRS
jgi:uncharacterized protein YdeI (BOF family)